jgi:hypothetical protein
MGVLPNQQMKPAFGTGTVPYTDHRQEVQYCRSTGAGMQRILV